MEILGRIRVGIRVVVDLGFFFGEDLRVRNGLVGYLSFGSFCRGEIEVREDSSMLAFFSRVKFYLGGRGFKMDR